MHISTEATLEQLTSAKPQHSQGHSKIVGIGYKLAEKLHLKQAGQDTA